MRVKHEFLTAKEASDISEANKNTYAPSPQLKAALSKIKETAQHGLRSCVLDNPIWRLYPEDINILENLGYKINWRGGPYLSAPVITWDK